MNLRVRCVTVHARTWMMCMNLQVSCVVVHATTGTDVVRGPMESLGMQLCGQLYGKLHMT